MTGYKWMTWPHRHSLLHEIYSMPTLGQTMGLEKWLKSGLVLRAHHENRATWDWNKTLSPWGQSRPRVSAKGSHTQLQNALKSKVGPYQMTLQKLERVERGKEENTYYSMQQNIPKVFFPPLHPKPTLHGNCSWFPYLHTRHYLHNLEFLKRPKFKKWIVCSHHKSTKYPVRAFWRWGEKSWKE